jgi:hypothetical protein
MIKGARKEMIVVRTGNSRYFDEAYFVLREEVQRDKEKSKDILGEANRILAEIASDPSHTQKKKKREWLFFAIGCACGTVLSIFLALLFI